VEIALLSEEGEFLPILVGEILPSCRSVMVNIQHSEPVVKVVNRDIDHLPGKTIQALNEINVTNERDVSAEMGKFLNRFAWTWWVTITFRDDVGSYTAWRRAKQFITYLERGGREKGRRRRSVGAFVALEVHRWSRNSQDTLTPHLHMLIDGVADLRRDEAWKFTFERNGRSRIEPYDKTRGAAYYITKYIAKEAFGRGEWDILDSNNRLTKISNDDILNIKSVKQNINGGGNSAYN